MVAVRSWRDATQLSGPTAMTRDDIPDVNRVFSDAFTERYRRDGLVGVRVPFLSHAVWRYAIEDSAGGAMLWRGDRGEVAAFNIAHCSGVEGWMGPLAVANEYQGGGAGKLIVRAALDWLRERGARVIGLETMPRTMDNIGFYSQLGFEPGKLTLTVSLDAIPAEQPPILLSRLREFEREDCIRGCSELLRALLPGYDFAREMRLTADLGLGDTLVILDHGEIAGFAICHSAPLIEGRAREELRILKLVCLEDSMDSTIRAVADHARRSGVRRAAVRVQGEYPEFYRKLIAMGGRVRWTDLRMTAPGYPEIAARRGVVLSNWEI